MDRIVVHFCDVDLQFLLLTFPNETGPPKKELKKLLTLLGTISWSGKGIGSYCRLDYYFQRYKAIVSQRRAEFGRTLLFASVSFAPKTNNLRGQQTHNRKLYVCRISYFPMECRQMYYKI